VEDGRYHGPRLGSPAPGGPARLLGRAPIYQLEAFFTVAGGGFRYVGAGLVTSEAIGRLSKDLPVSNIPKVARVSFTRRWAESLSPSVPIC